MPRMSRNRKAAYLAAMLIIVTFGWASVFLWDNGAWLVAAMVAFAVVYGSYYGEAVA
jgi:hypothetical protein